MESVEEYRYLAQLCRDRAAMRPKPEDRKLMLGAAAEFDRLAAGAETQEKATSPSQPH